MAYFFLDDSKHHAWGFSLGAFVICDTDPQAELTSLLAKCGYDPSRYEFKSSARMKGNPQLQRLRNVLKWFIRSRCKVAVCIVDGDEYIGPASLQLLQKALTHKNLKGGVHQVYFDEGLFPSRKMAERNSSEIDGLDKCCFHFEQDSQTVAGIQVADLAAHTCGIMLLDALGHVDKKVQIKNSGYPEDVEIDLGFELWASLRYEFLSENKTEFSDEFDDAFVAVEPYGLFIHDSVGKAIAKAARERFSEMYLGCIH